MKKDSYLFKCEANYAYCWLAPSVLLLMCVCLMILFINIFITRSSSDEVLYFLLGMTMFIALLCFNLYGAISNLQTAFFYKDRIEIRTPVLLLKTIYTNNIHHVQNKKLLTVYAHGGDMTTMKWIVIYENGFDDTAEIKAGCNKKENRYCVISYSERKEKAIQKYVNEYCRTKSLKKQNRK